MSDNNGQSPQKDPSQSGLYISLIGLLIAIVTCIAAILVVPEFRLWLGLDHLSTKEKVEVPASSKNAIDKEKNGVLGFSTNVSDNLKNDRTGRVLLLIQEDSIARTLSEKMNHHRLSITFGSEIDTHQIQTSLQKLQMGDQNAGQVIPFAVIVIGNTSITTLEPYEGLHTSIASGKLKAIATKNGRTVALENFSNIRGFGNTQEQASANAIEKVGQTISDSFILEVSTNSH